MKDPTLDEIIEARNRCAQYIVAYGEAYLAIFERLENEIKARENQRDLLELALTIGTQNGTQSGTHLKTHFAQII